MTSLANAQLLTSGRSQKLVQAPGPNVEQLQQMLAAAVCAPDHSALRAWRFALVLQPIPILGCQSKLDAHLCLGLDGDLKYLDM
jgi:nitroreductase